jgi:hypothetical protein
MLPVGSPFAGGRRRSWKWLGAGTWPGLPRGDLVGDRSFAPRSDPASHGWRASGRPTAITPATWNRLWRNVGSAAALAADAQAAAAPNAWSARPARYYRQVWERRRIALKRRSWPRQRNLLGMRAPRTAEGVRRWRTCPQGMSLQHRTLLEDKGIMPARRVGGSGAPEHCHLPRHWASRVNEQTRPAPDTGSAVRPSTDPWLRHRCNSVRRPSPSAKTDAASGASRSVANAAVCAREDPVDL